MSNPLSEHFRLWYRHECDCNDKVIAMLQSVPKEARTQPDFQWAVARLEHLIRARQNWYERLHGRSDAEQDWFPESADLEELKSKLASIEQTWTAYLDSLSDS